MSQAPGASGQAPTADAVTSVKTPAQRAFLTLADHCTACPTCCPPDRRPTSERDKCETADDLYRAWSGLFSKERS